VRGEDVGDSHPYFSAITAVDVLLVKSLEVYGIFKKVASRFSVTILSAIAVSVILTVDIRA
jgi:hypothetical protein